MTCSTVGGPTAAWRRGIVREQANWHPDRIIPVHGRTRRRPGPELQEFPPNPRPVPERLLEGPDGEFEIRTDHVGLYSAATIDGRADISAGAWSRLIAASNSFGSIVNVCVRPG